ncbi:cell death abnormality protein 1-like [Ostrea edulis]|uniref:cell death abnormality protein 1-like n=1 Tax=Ostrea edulis TaxID=37623 RepID=UPI0024AF6386|nr:cell death abnormality protein 1-like [Ostrea edulis]
MHVCMYNQFLLVLPACRCPLGFIGTDCEKQCPYPGYGEHCQMTCNCEEQYCNHTTGCQAGSPTLPPIVRSTTSSHIMSSINPTTKECSPGYTGNNCDIPCRYPSYGVSCQLECNCTEGNCHFQTGCIDHTTAEDEEKPSCNDTQSGRTMRRESLEYGVAVLGPVAVIQFSAYFCLRYLYRPAVYEINHL